MEALQLKEVGRCDHCKREISVTRDTQALRTHRHKGKRCKGSDYSVCETHLVIETDVEAREVALFLRDDDPSRCITAFGGLGHSMACADGRMCAETRQKFASAFARYYLAHTHAN